MPAKIGLALSGGGARGIAHIGVLKVLEGAQIPVHVLAGTSMGGIVAAIYAAGRSAAEIERLARSLRLLDIVQRDHTRLGLLGQDKIASRVREALGGDLAFDQLKLPLALIAADLETGEEVVIREGSVVEGVLATAALPIVFPPVHWQGRLLVDGGVLNPVPFDVVRQMGADRVIAVHIQQDLSGRPGTETPLGGRSAEAVIRLLLHRAPWAPMIDVAERSQGIMSRKLIEQRMQDAPPDLMIEVPLKGVGLLDLDQVDMCIRVGEELSRQYLPKLIELRDTPLPGRWTRWWQSAISKWR
ncbi:MAG: patatin-like phospholipase family protein [Anaerolineae bacterium]